MSDIMTVVDCDREAREVERILWPAGKSPTVKVIDLKGSVSKTAAIKAKSLFVLCSTSHLPFVADVIRKSNDRHRLRALFLREDTDPMLLPQMLDRANLRTLRNMLVHTEWVLPRRVLGAWEAGAQKRLIANATVVNDRLLVLNCVLERFELSFDDVAALGRIPKTDRSGFEISEDGSYLHWPREDVHLNMDAIRYITDSDWRQREDTRRVTADENFGAAVARLRKELDLRQRDITRLSARQVSRIENGARPSYESLNALAIAHRMTVNQYLEAIAQSLGND